MASVASIADMAHSLSDTVVEPVVKGFFHEASQTVSYIVREPDGNHAVVIDPVLDYHANAARISTEFADQQLAYIEDNELQIDWILETHPHSDHLSAAQYLKARLEAPVVIGRQIRVVQQTFARLYNLENSFQVNGSQFDRLVNDGDSLKAGALNISVMHTPGHTPACVTYCIGNTAFVGDTLFMPDQGTARADFPGGDARSLYRSIQKIMALPASTRLCLCHDYATERSAEWETTVAEQRMGNCQANARMTEEAFIRLREEQDSKLDMPELILPSIQFNLRGGALPPAEENGVAYLKIPVNILR